MFILSSVYSVNKYKITCVVLFIDSGERNNIDMYNEMTWNVNILFAVMQCLPVDKGNAMKDDILQWINII